MFIIFLLDRISNHPLIGSRSFILLSLFAIDIRYAPVFPISLLYLKGLNLADLCAKCNTALAVRGVVLQDARPPLDLPRITLRYSTLSSHNPL